MQSQPKTCQQCGAAFVCGSGGRDGQCWCMNTPAFLPLPSDGSDCLCPVCLDEKKAQAQQPAPSSLA
ncbi:cysteine-rich CWC family protein [Chitinibacter bivalviorum]|uniref:Cysteine-rich CWC family protein n=1 Tax=Chitinibacter bivalviorum TaxID=2739434 RepID=A0A7H9BP22_9NEIS|nr:cysteine-rich CWC family protein [Chitinibacter bivalviorum]QLG89074.1 cysteine-rich CWC family protein [Chitinibacter bivalviorum]